MKKFLTIALIILSFTANAGQRAVTDEGDIVILNNDGTWKYESIDKPKSTEIRVNKSTFKKNSTLTFLIKSGKNKSAVWISPKNGHLKNRIIMRMPQSTNLRIKIRTCTHWQLLRKLKLIWKI